LFQAKPEIWNSDQGSHFTSPKYLDRLRHEEIKISMVFPQVAYCY
jgi:putative transposase